MKTNIARGLVVMIIFCAGNASAENAGSTGPLTLLCQQPAADVKPMNEALPIGNGRLGTLVFGAPQRERHSLNEDSLWTGDDNPRGDYKSKGMSACEDLARLTDQTYRNSNDLMGKHWKREGLDE